MSLSRAIHSVLHKLLHKYYVVVWGVCKPPLQQFWAVWKRGAWEDVLRAGRHLLRSVAFVWQRSFKACCGSVQQRQKKFLKKVIYKVYKSFGMWKIDLAVLYSTTTFLRTILQDLNTFGFIFKTLCIVDLKIFSRIPIFKITCIL